MYGESESEEESGRRENESEFIELKREVVEPRTLFHREQELYFYDTFAYPWEKNKHYKMVYQLEKKYFPDQGFDKAFLPLGESNAKRGKKELGRKGVEDDKRLVFFDENEKDGKVGNVTEMKVGDVTEKKVEEFFKCLKKFPNEKDGDVAVAEPFLSTRSAGLPPKWDGPNGTVVLVNKPKGECFSFLLQCIQNFRKFSCGESIEEVMFSLQSRTLASSLFMNEIQKSCMLMLDY